MNLSQLKKKAEELMALLSHYAEFDKEAEGLLHGLLPFTDRAFAECLEIPLDWTDMPGCYLFNEGTLGKYADFETAFAEFKIEITGGETPAFRKLRKRERFREKEDD